MKIVSLAPSNTDILFSLGAGKDVMASVECDHPVKLIDDISVEKLKKFNADMIFTSCEDQKELTAELEENGLPVTHVFPKNLRDVFDSITVIGELIDKPEEASTLTEELSAKLEELREYKYNKPKLYVEASHNPPKVAGYWVPDIAEIAGFDYGLVKSGRPGREISTEEIFKYNPDAIVLSIRKGDKSALSMKKDWLELDAIKNKKVYVIDHSVINPSPKILEGCTELRKIISSF